MEPRSDSRAGWRLRPHREEDAEEIATFLAEASDLDPTIQPVSAAGWRSFAGMPFNRRARDFAVAEEDGRIVGLLTSTLLDGERGAETIRHFRIIVHPERRRRGIGAELYALATRSERGERIVQCNCPDEWAEGRRFLERRGFAPVEADLEMTRPALPKPERSMPEGVSIRAYRGREDHAVWAAIYNEAFGGERSFARQTAETIASYAEVEGFRLWIAEREGSAVGFCSVVDAGPDEGTIESLATRSRERGRGIGRALTTRAMCRLADEGKLKLRLNVFEENLPAVSLYRSLGFRIASRTHRYWLGPRGQDLR